MIKFFDKWGKSFLWYDFVFTFLSSMMFCLFLYRYHNDFVHQIPFFSFLLVFFLNLYIGVNNNIQVNKMMQVNNPRLNLLKKSGKKKEIENTLESFNYYLRSIGMLGVIGFLFGNHNFIYLFFIVTMLVESRLIRCIWIKNQLFELLTMNPIKDDNL